jgi:uncharacterized membrane protein
MPFRRVPFGHGWRWIARAFGLFRRNPLIWIVLNLVLLLIVLAADMLPVIGLYLVYLLTPLFLAGLMTACRDADAGQEIEIAHLFAGFRQSASQLVTVGGVYLVGNVAIAGVAMYVGGAELRETLQAAAEGAPERIAPEVANKAATAVLLAAALFLPLAMAVWFAPALVILDRVPAPRALVLSMRACLANFLPFLLYGALMSVLLFLALLLVFVGLVVWMPVAVISAYTSYRDVFETGLTQA